MKTFSTTDEDFEKDIKKSQSLVLVDFWAEWCAPCKQISPILEEIASEYESKIKVLKINIDENSQTPHKYNVRGIPTLMIFKNGNLIDTKVGSLPKSSIEAWLQPNL